MTTESPVYDGPHQTLLSPLVEQESPFTEAEPPYTGLASPLVDEDQQAEDLGFGDVDTEAATNRDVDREGGPFEGAALAEREEPGARETEEAAGEEAESGEVELGEAEAYFKDVSWPEPGLAEETGLTVTFPSGATLRVVSGPTGVRDEHYDPLATGNPLLDTGEPVRATLLSRNFTVSELTRSGGSNFSKARIDPELVRCLQNLRDRVGRPLNITSSYRPYGYNNKLYRQRYKKDPTKSRHSSGQAADIRIAGMSGMEIAKAAIDACGTNIGLGIAERYAHIDVRGRWARWTYFGARSERHRRTIAEIDAYRRQLLDAGGTPAPTPSGAPVREEQLSAMGEAPPAYGSAMEADAEQVPAGDGGEAPWTELAPEELMAGEGFFGSAINAISQAIGVAQAIAGWLPDVTGGAAPPETTAFVARLIAGGIHDENKLTDIIFRIAHPEVGNRQLNAKDERDQPLIKDWLKLRDRLVLPELRRQRTSPPLAIPKGPPTPDIHVAPAGMTPAQFLAAHRGVLKERTSLYPTSDDEMLVLLGAIMNRYQDRYFDIDGRYFTNGHRFEDFRPPVTADSPLPLRQMMFMHRHPGKVSGWLYTWDKKGNRLESRSENPSLTADDWKELGGIANDLVYPVLRYVLPLITSPEPVISNSSVGEQVAARAYCYLGVRYALGSWKYDPKPGGLDCAVLLREGHGTLDCSALVNYVYWDILGRRLKLRGTDPDGGVDYIKQGGDFQDLGCPKSVTPQPGDLLLVHRDNARNGKGGWAHIAIFVGAGHLVDAWYTGTVVRKRAYDPEQWHRVLRYDGATPGPAVHPELLDEGRQTRQLFPSPEMEAEKLEDWSTESPAAAPEQLEEPGASAAQRILDALGQRLWSLAVALAIQSGNRDESRLTDMVFQGRHPELKGRAIAAHERDLAAEWVDIRQTIVRPALQVTPQPVGGRPQVTGSAPIGPFGTLTVEVPGWEFAYRLTSDDVEWTAKLILLESSGNDDAQNRAVIWAMFNRYALFTHKVKSYPTFSAFIRAYSTTLQPVLVNVNAARAHYGNPGSKYVPIPGAGYYPGTNIPRGQLARHLRFQKVPWSELKQETRLVAERTLKGYVDNPGIGNASEFGSSRIWWQRDHKTKDEPSKEQWINYTKRITCSKKRPCFWIGEIPRLDQMANAFFLDCRAEKLPSNAVRVIPAQ